MQHRPRRARHLAQVAGLLAVGLAGGHAGGGGGAGRRYTAPPADETPFVLNCHCFKYALGVRKIPGSLLKLKASL